MALRSEKWIKSGFQRKELFIKSFPGELSPHIWDKPGSSQDPALDPDPSLVGGRGGFTFSQRARPALKTIPVTHCVNHLLLPGLISGGRPWCPWHISGDRACAAQGEANAMVGLFLLCPVQKVMCCQNRIHYTCV